MTSQRKLRALRNLAERPGTEAEGDVARTILANLEAKHAKPKGSTISIDGINYTYLGNVEMKFDMSEIIKATEELAEFGRMFRGYSKEADEDLPFARNAIHHNRPKR